MGQRDQEPLAVGVRALLEAEPGREFRHARAGRVGRRQRATVLVKLETFNPDTLFEEEALARQRGEGEEDVAQPGAP